ncbi:MAG: hypothetical protein ABIR24_10915, partial [Verrucomicrobiota bacterium]
MAEVASGRGLPHSKSFARFLRCKNRASVVECASPLALLHRDSFLLMALANGQSKGQVVEAKSRTAQPIKPG